MIIKYSDFILLRKYIYKHTGIFLKDTKNILLTNRIAKRMRELKINSIPEYIKFLFENPKNELQNFIDAITTNETYFFREEKHWNYIINQVIPEKISNKDKSIKIWSAACSTGEEAYTSLIILYENIPDIHNWEITIYGTDINSEVIEKAKRAVFPENNLRLVSFDIKTKYFDKKSKYFYLKDKYKNIVQFYKHNLLKPLHSIKFDIIICRNLFIYFNLESKDKVISNILKSLKKDGCFFIGHSENFNEDKFNLEYVDTSVLKFLS